MPMTLYEAAKRYSGEVKRQSVIEMFANASNIMRIIPLMDIPGESYTYNLEAKLPGVGFRGYNGAFAESYGVINPQVEVLRIAGGDLDVDRQLIRTRGEGVRTSEEAMKIKAMSLYLGDRMVHGDSLTDPREFDGIRRRAAGPQLFPANLASPSANGALSIETLQAAIDQVEAPNGIVCSKAMKRKLSKAAAANLGGDINIEKDEFGFRVTMFDDLPLILVDFNHLGQRVIEFNEAGPAGGTTSQSVYVANFGDGYVMGIQNGDMEVRDLGELEAKPVLRTRVEWMLGLAVLHGRAMARVWGITNADVVA